MAGTRSRESKNESNVVPPVISDIGALWKLQEEIVRVSSLEVGDCSQAVIFAVDVYQHPERCARYFKIATAGAAERP